MHLLAFVLCVAAFACLALAMERHQEDLYQRTLPARTTRLLRAAGWALLLVALAVIVSVQGWGLGLVSFSGHTSFAAGLVCLGLVIHNRRKTG